MSNLKKMRKHLNLSQAGMAELIGLTLRGYQDIEGGRAKEREIHLQSARWGALYYFETFFDDVYDAFEVNSLVLKPRLKKVH